MGHGHPLDWNFHDSYRISHLARNEKAGNTALGGRRDNDRLNFCDRYVDCGFESQVGLLRFLIQ